MPVSKSERKHRARVSVKLRVVEYYLRVTTICWILFRWRKKDIDERDSWQEGGRFVGSAWWTSLSVFSWLLPTYQASSLAPGSSRGSTALTADRRRWRLRRQVSRLAAVHKRQELNLFPNRVRLEIPPWIISKKTTNYNSAYILLSNISA